VRSIQRVEKENTMARTAGSHSVILEERNQTKEPACCLLEVTAFWILMTQL